LIEVVAPPSVAGKPGRSQQGVTDDPDDEDSVDDTDQADVEAHVAVQDVAEFVGDHALELVAGELLGAAARHADHRVTRREARGEGVDAAFVVQHVDRGRRRSRGDRHLLDDVLELSLRQVARVGVDEAAAEALGDGLPAASKLRDLEQAATSDDGEREQSDLDEQLRVPPPEFREPRSRGRVVRLISDDEDGERVEHRDDGDHREDEEQDQTAGLSPGAILILEEIRRHGETSGGWLPAGRAARGDSPQKETFGASAIASLSNSRSAASWT
jgi:hypothetical protein